VGVRATTSWEGEDLVVTPVGFWAKLWCFRSRIVIPFDKIIGVRTTDEPRRLIRWWVRIGGTWLPGLVMAGRYGLFQPRAFAVVGTARPVVVIETRDYRYQYVVFSNDEPEATARKIEKAIGRRA
jgi:hypothetical protein